MSYAQLSGVTYHDPSIAYDTLVLFSGADEVTRLIDLAGNVRKEWPYAGVPPRIVDPALNDGRLGEVGVQLSHRADGPGGVYANHTIGQVSWDGEVLWEWGTQAPGGHAHQNHDWETLPNGNRLVLVAVSRTIPLLGDFPVGDQCVYEVSPEGEIAWKWSVGDHLEQLGFSEEGLDLLRKTVAFQPDNPWGILEINSAKTLGPNHWHDSDPDTVFQPDNFIISSRKANIIALVSRRTGDIVWRIGPYAGEPVGHEHQRINRHNVPRPVDQTSGQHNPHMIAKGLPGAGNVLVFDNQGGAGYPNAALGIYAGSRILEINPQTKEIVWQYTAEDSGRPTWTFHSSFVSNAERLPNGNTQICEGMTGRIFQVTPSGQVAWEYHSPYDGVGVAGEWEVRRPTVPDVDRLVQTRLVYRAQAVPFSWVPQNHH